MRGRFVSNGDDCQEQFGSFPGLPLGLKMYEFQLVLGDKDSCLLVQVNRVVDIAHTYFTSASNNSADYSNSIFCDTVALPLLFTE